MAFYVFSHKKRTEIRQNRLHSVLPRLILNRQHASLFNGIGLICDDKRSSVHIRTHSHAGFIHGNLHHPIRCRNLARNASEAHKIRPYLIGRISRGGRTHAERIFAEKINR